MYFFVFIFFLLTRSSFTSSSNEVTHDDLLSLNQDFMINAAGGGDLYSVKIKEATMVFPVLNELIDIVDPTFQLIVLKGDKLVDKNEQSHLHHFFHNNNNNKHKHKHDDYIQFKEHLFEVFEKSGSDKSYHKYHGLYALIFKNLGHEKSLTTLEVGLGTNDTSKVSHMYKGVPGASLHAFAAFLPNAHIYGADIDSNILFQTERITTGFADQLDSNSMVRMNEKFGNKKFDLIIDDALHSSVASFNQLIFAIKNINTPGWIVVEDIRISFFRQYRIFDYILRSKVSSQNTMINSFMWTGNDSDYLYVISITEKK